MSRTCAPQPRAGSARRPPLGRQRPVCPGQEGEPPACRPRSGASATLSTPLWARARPGAAERGRRCPAEVRGRPQAAQGPRSGLSSGDLGPRRPEGTWQSFSWLGGGMRGGWSGHPKARAVLRGARFPLSPASGDTAHQRLPQERPGLCVARWAGDRRGKGQRGEQPHVGGSRHPRVTCSGGAARASVGRPLEGCGGAGAARPWAMTAFTITFFMLGGGGACSGCELLIQGQTGGGRQDSAWPRTVLPCWWLRHCPQGGGGSRAAPRPASPWRGGAAPCCTQRWRLRSDCHVAMRVAHGVRAGLWPGAGWRV